MQTSILGIALSPIALVLASCGPTGAGDSEATTTSTPSPATATGGESVELQKTSPFAAASFGRFAEPWALAIEPGTGNVFITEKAGTMKFFQPRTGRTGTVSGLPRVDYGGQGGLGDFVFAPDYASSKTVYLSWVEAGDGDTRGAVVGRGNLACQDQDRCAISDLRIIWRQAPKVTGRGHYSHRIAFSPDGRYLFVSSGERQKKDPAQDLSNNLGTIVRLNLDGTPAAGNPFSDRGTPTDQVWSYGHRNTLGIAFDPDGQLFNLEHGPAGGDEINRIEPGENYGWPVRSNGDNYDGSKIPNHSPDDGFTKPVIYWTPVIAPGDMIFYTGAMFADWRGQALVANLRTTSISRVSFAADKNSAKEEARYEFPERLRDIAQGPDGSLWVIEDGEKGRLLKLTKAR